MRRGAGSIAMIVSCRRRTPGFTYSRYGSLAASGVARPTSRRASRSPGRMSHPCRAGSRRLRRQAPQKAWWRAPCSRNRSRERVFGLHRGSVDVTPVPDAISSSDRRRVPPSASTDRRMPRERESWFPQVMAVPPHMLRRKRLATPATYGLDRDCQARASRRGAPAFGQGAIRRAAHQRGHLASRPGDACTRRQVTVVPLQSSRDVRPPQTGGLLPPTPREKE